jgi:hypothetical protein
MNATYERNGMRITRAKMPCRYFGPVKWFGELGYRKAVCWCAKCPQWNKHCTEDFRQAEVRCANYQDAR